MVKPLSHEMTKGAILSDCGTYRYRLWRRWGFGPRMLWVMLNPSTADADVDDPTIRRCMGFARREGCDAIDVINLYAYRATDPKELLTAPCPEGPENLHHWTNALYGPPKFKIAAWGAFAKKTRYDWRRATFETLANTDFLCLGQTRDGSPKHPLYVKSDQELVPWA